MTGVIAQAFGFAWGFVTLGIAAGVGMAAVGMLLPETVHQARQ